MSYAVAAGGESGKLHRPLADLEAIEQLHEDKAIGDYDAAVIDKEDGKPHVVKRMDRPHIRVIPEWFGELKEALKG